MKVAWNMFYRNNLQNHFIEPHDNIIASVSGGIDSVCMLHMLYRLKKKFNVNILIVTFNHNLRQESSIELKLVKHLASKLQFDCFIQEFNVKEYAKKHSLSIETAGRRLRYFYLEDIAKKYHYNKISIAHNANDNAETMLMWLIRGSGNFIGIPYIRKIEKNVLIIRPLIGIRRTLIESYVRYYNLPFCHDSSNDLDVYTRNKIRLSIIPLLESLNPKFIEHIFNITCIQSRDSIYLSHIVNTLQKQCVNSNNNQISLDLTIFLRYNKAIQFRIIKNILPEKKCNSHINFIMNKLLTSSSICSYRLSKKWTCKITTNKVFFIKNQ
ncbi:MAG: tRNA lysidine(34) synthetase TilS [Endomicrobium sp.]|jgi:tRNA(Ile)-lysidine synthase|nr:tRNA lysidine(34) synthetase TilS [Endomicrobium sp.]